MRTFEDRAFLLLLAAVSVAFAGILWPYYQAVLWGAIAAIVFAPLNRRMRHLTNGRRNLAALLTLLIVLSLVILPALAIGASLAREGSVLFRRVQSGELDPTQFFQQAIGALPGWALALLDEFGLADLSAMQERLSAGLKQVSQTLAAQALNVGQGTFNFVIGLGVMLYLLFFLLRDGDEIAKRVRDAVPLAPQRRGALFRRFVVVIRATVKGNVLVAGAQGALGALIFWFLGVHPVFMWAVLMAFAALVPAIGAALIWAPVSLYLFATAPAWQGLLLIIWGVLVIGLADNVLRPILVGKDSKLPDYVVLVSTLGGLALFGASGLVIGPVIAALFMAAWSIFTEARGQSEGSPISEA
jgi:predicted PurR-regulated permease PerM